MNKTKISFSAWRHSLVLKCNFCGTIGGNDHILPSEASWYHHQSQSKAFDKRNKWEWVCCAHPFLQFWEKGYQILLRTSVISFFDIECNICWITTKEKLNQKSNCKYTAITAVGLLLNRLHIEYDFVSSCAKYRCCLSQNIGWYSAMKITIKQFDSWVWWINSGYNNLVIGVV